MSTDYKLRAATAEDMELLYEWANDPEVRKSSFSQDPIPLEDHKKWFDALLKDDKKIQLILERDDTPIGQVRFHMDGDEASIHYSIAPGERGKGYGKLLIEMASAELHKTHPEIKKILAGVKPDNPASQKCFTSNGYEEKYIIYELNL